MKKALLIVILALPLVSRSQTNAYKTITVTNWVNPGPVLRVVNGITYHIDHSKLWGSPISLNGGLPTSANNAHPIRYEIVAERIETNKIVCEIDAITYWFETYTAAPQDEDRDRVKTIVIYHYPHPDKLVTGEPFSFLCMRVTNCIENGISYEAYDCGIQATNPIPVIKQIKVKVQTESPNN